MQTQSAIHLICSVGTGKYEEVSYNLQGRSHSSKFPSAALAHLLDIDGGQASVLTTPSAFDAWYEELASELSRARLEPRPVTISEGRSEDEMMGIFESIVNEAQENETVYLDVTFGLRHLPFAYLAALTYLTAYKNVSIAGIYYGAFELRDPDTGDVPILDMTPLFRLTRWYHALQMVQDTGDLIQVGAMLREDVASLFKGGQRDVALSDARGLLQSLAEALSSGLPLEAGIRAKALSSTMTRLDSGKRPTSAGSLALNHLTRWVDEWAIQEDRKDKSELELDLAELQRQLRVARWHMERNDLPAALLLLREWMVNLYLLHYGNTGDWLSLATRRAIEGQLNALTQRRQAGTLHPSEESLVSTWQQVRDLRNKYAHAGMTTEPVRVSYDVVARLHSQCEILAHSKIPDLRPGAAGRILVTPLGLSPGILQTAVSHTKPDEILIVTSRAASERLPEALAKAGASHLPVTLLEMKDPHTGFKEAESLIDGPLKRLLASRQEALVNIAGGTTAMQYVVERISDEAFSLGVPVTKGAVVDRRPPSEQRANPYVTGEWVELRPPLHSGGSETDE